MSMSRELCRGRVSYLRQDDLTEPAHTQGFAEELPRGKRYDRARLGLVSALFRGQRNGAKLSASGVRLSRRRGA